MKVRIAAIITLGLLAAGCSKTSPETQTRLVEVPSSKPYRYITFDSSDSPDTIRQVKRHNRAHQEVIRAEQTAKAGANAR